MAHFLGVKYPHDRTDATSMLSRDLGIFFPDWISMTTLGVNVASNVAYIALADGTVVLDTDPPQLDLPGGMDAANRLAEFSSEVLRVFEQLDVTRIRILDAESLYRGTYQSLLPRITIETVILVAAAKRDGQRMSRAKCRSLLNLPKQGTLSSLVDQVTPSAGSAWRNKRDLAALAALAGEQEVS
jgi:hypothetical protein